MNDGNDGNVREFLSALVTMALDGCDCDPGLVAAIAQAIDDEPAIQAVCDTMPPAAGAAFKRALVAVAMHGPDGPLEIATCLSSFAVVAGCVARAMTPRDDWPARETAL